MSLGKVYYDPKHPAGFGSVANLVNTSKNKKRDVGEWLPSQNTYTLHKQVRKRFPRNPYTVTNIDDVWEIDFADLSSLPKYNDKYKYLLNVIDIFTVRLECSSKEQDRYINYISFKIFIPK